MLHVHRAARADVLADALARLLAEPAADPFAPEVVAVPTRGMERWLAQRMSAILGAGDGREDGVCANVLFPTPHRLATEAVALASDTDPDGDPWLPERSCWTLLGVVDGALHEPWLAPLASYLGAGERDDDRSRRSRRLATVGHLATLYHRYALHRPWMLDAWRSGANVDSIGMQLPQVSAWQPELWRRLRARIGTPDLVERTASACLRLRQEPELLELGQRICIFGLTRLPAGRLEVLRALAVGRDVHLFLLHPSAVLWKRVGGLAGDAAREAIRGPSVDAGREAIRGPTGDAGPAVGGRVPLREDDPSAAAASNRLLASWGRDAREMEVVLASGAGPIVEHDHDPPAPPLTLLGRIQADIRADREPPGPALTGAQDLRPALDAGDASIEIHSCHGRARQVEVIRDAILHALAEDPTLEPRDVIVMCPDVETFAPLIQAAFGEGETEPAGHELRVRLADRSLRQTNQVLDAVSRLLELVEQRITASQLLDLADREPVRRRFAFDDRDIGRLQRWISQSAIRWGLDASHRARFGLGTLDSGTWTAGLDRLALGVTMTEDGQRLFADVLPVDDVDSGAIELAGRFAELVSRVAVAVRTLSARQTLTGWADTLGTAADALTATAERDRWQRTELHRVLGELVAEAGADPTELAPAELRAHLARRLEGRPTRASFRTGHLTVCTLVPMRSVPHRVVCLLGLDDGAFPRRAPRDGDDLMLTQPCVGERDPRSEDRQLLLDALLAAQERLIISFTGNDERTNAPCPPAVPVGELVDAIDATVRIPSGPAREAVLVRHPLQPFHPRNFMPGAITPQVPWSFDPAALAGARALTAPRGRPRPFLARPLDVAVDPVVELDDLVAFLEHPVRAFLRRRLGVSVRAHGDEVEDGLRLALDGLQRWGIGRRLLEARLRGVAERPALLAEIARGTLPPGALGQPVITRLSPIVTAIIRAADRAVSRRPEGEPVDVSIELADGRLLSGTVIGAHGDMLLATTFSRVTAKQRLAAWARLLALSAGRPERPWQASTVGRGSGDDDVRVAQIEPLAATAAERGGIARELLSVLVDLYDRGLREPLPLFCETSCAYAEAARGGRDPVGAARERWETAGSRFEREDRDAEHRLVYGEAIALQRLLAQPPQAGEHGAGWPADEPTRFGRCALRLWEPLLARERIWAR